MIKHPVFSGPSGRKPERRFDPRTGDYVDKTDPLGKFGDTLMPRGGADFITKKIRVNLREQGEMNDERAGREMRIDVMRRLEEPLRLERPQGSSFHHLLEYIQRLKGRNEIAESFVREKFHLFVVEHDWAAAFRGSVDFSSGDIQLPFDYTCFELRVSGMRMLMLVGGEERLGFLGVGLHDRWIGSLFRMLPDGTIVPTPREDLGSFKIESESLLTLLRDQVRATCVMLDAEVAETEVRRAPERLNRARERQGRTLLRDYHVVRLAHRHRVRASEERAHDADADYTRKRLHFRRGHDRHYQNYKVWIRWQLVGDPELGFVDKEYRL